MARKKKETKKEVPESTATKKKAAKEEAPKEAPGTTPEEEMQQRIRSCNEELMGVLKKYNCDLEANILLKPGMVIPQIRIVPVEIMQQRQRQQQEPQIIT